MPQAIDVTLNDRVTTVTGENANVVIERLRRDAFGLTYHWSD